MTALSSLSLREKALILAMIVVSTLAAGYVYAWEPLAQARARSLAEIERADRAAARLAAYDGPAVQRDPAARETLGVLIASSAIEHGIAISRLEPEGSFARVSISKVKFEMFIGWLADLKSSRAARVAAVEIERLTEPGVVAARLTLGR